MKNITSIFDTKCINKELLVNDAVVYSVIGYGLNTVKAVGSPLQSALLLAVNAVVKRVLNSVLNVNDGKVTNFFCLVVSGVISIAVLHLTGVSLTVASAALFIVAAEAVNIGARLLVNGTIAVSTCVGNAFVAIENCKFS